jgi:hypothetical protein
LELQSGLAPDQLKNFMLQEEISPLANGMGGRLDERRIFHIDGRNHFL